MHQHLATYFFGRQVFGPYPIQSSWPVLSSHVYVCARCADVWCRIVSSSDPTFIVHVAPCVNHLPAGVQDWSHVPGSILKTAMSADFISVLDKAIALDSLPEPVLAREAQVHLAHFERTHHG